MDILFFSLQLMIYTYCLRCSSGLIFATAAFYNSVRNDNTRMDGPALLAGERQLAKICGYGCSSLQNQSFRTPIRRLIR